MTNSSESQKPEGLSEIDKGIVYSGGIKSLLEFSILSDIDYAPSWLHKEISNALEAVERGEIKRLIIEVPPRHGKTQLATINFPAWYLGRNPKREIITASYNDSLAQEFGGKTRDLVASEEYQSIFETKLRPDSQSKARWETTEGGAYTSVGVGGALTGRGANVLLIDDPIKNREEAESEVMQKRVWDWYTSTARTRLEKDAAVIVIMTRWHLYDLVGRLLEQEGRGGEKWHRITFPALATVVEPNRGIGDALWPEKYDIEALKATRMAIGERDFLALYQQQPVASENADFNANWFSYFEENDTIGKNFQYYTSVDPAISKGKDADNTVIRTIGKEMDRPEIYLIEETATHLDPGQTIEALFMHVSRYRPIKVGIESVAYQQSLIYFVQEEQKKRSLYFDVEAIKTTSDKTQRLRGLVPYYKTGVIKHRRSDVELESELLQFPSGKHDDRIDALQMAVALTTPTEYYRMGSNQKTFSGNITY